MTLLQYPAPFSPARVLTATLSMSWSAGGTTATRVTPPSPGPRTRGSQTLSTWTPASVRLAVRLVSICQRRKLLEIWVWKIKDKDHLYQLSNLILDREFIVQRRKDLQDFLNKVLDQDQLANNLCTKQFLDLQSYTLNFQGVILKSVNNLVTEDFRDCSPACFNGPEKQLQVWSWKALSWGGISTKVPYQIKCKNNGINLLYTQVNCLSC